MHRLTPHQNKEIELHKKMKRLKIFDKDIKESFVRSSKPGGQNVNKVSTCVTLVHIPTAIKVKCQDFRSQTLNRFKAKLELVSRIEKAIKEKYILERAKREKLKRQNRKRPTFLKEVILERKHKKSEKKFNRRKIDIKQVDEF